MPINIAIGTVSNVPSKPPIALRLGRRPMFAIYFVGSALAIWAAFGAPVAAETRLWLLGGVGLTVFGVFGAFSFYLPELFPMRLRGTGAGFCYNAGRVVAAAGPFLVGTIASRGTDALASAMHLLFLVGFVPLAGLLLLPFAVETKGRVLA